MPAGSVPAGQSGPTPPPLHVTIMTNRMEENRFEIQGRVLGPGCSPYIVGEISGNHGGSLDTALTLIDAAAEAGIDAVKLQTYTADTITLNSDRPEFRLEDGLWSGETLYQLYQRAHTPWEWHPTLFERARARGLAIFSSPFDPTAVDFLETLDCPCYKIASFELVDLPLIRRVAATGKPIVMSTGMATLAEIEEAVAAARGAGATALCVLHCTSAYPANASAQNLATIADMRARLGCLIGLSDHTVGTAVPVAAAALGVALIEKHITLRGDGSGVDDAFSVGPTELKKLVEDVRTAHAALGAVNYTRSPEEAANRRFRRSLYVVKSLSRGDVLTGDAVRSVRPANGLAPKYLEAALGCRLTRDVAAGEPLSLDMLEDFPIPAE